MHNAGVYTRLWVKYADRVAMSQLEKAELNYELRAFAPDKIFILSMIMIEALGVIYNLNLPHLSHA